MASIPGSTFLRSPLAIWIVRVIVGGVFAFSGWVKCIDPWGFVYKLTDYLNVWGWDVSRPLIVAGAIGMAVAEMTVGVLIALGAWRRVTIWTCAAWMAVMTPLTLWLWCTDAVPDCGCFGDAVVMSNAVTFWKNVVLDLLIIYLWIYNRGAAGLLKAQFCVYGAALTVVYGLILGLTGYLVQPFIDFRAYAEGADLRAATDPELEAPVDFDLFDNEDEEVGQQLWQSPDTVALLLVPEPSLVGLQMAHFAQRLNELYPTFTVTPEEAKRDDQLMAEDTQIKAMARGDVALMMLADGRVLWKRSLALTPSDLLDTPQPREAFTALRPHLIQRFWLYTTIYLLLLALCVLMPRRNNYALR